MVLTAAQTTAFFKALTKWGSHMQPWCKCNKTESNRLHLHMVACGIPIWSGLSKKAVVRAAVNTMIKFFPTRLATSTMHQC